MAIKDDNKKILDFDLQMEDQDQSFPMLQVLNNDGEIVDEDALKRAGLSDDQMVELMKQMVFSRILHERSSKLSKQGRLGFYAPTIGEEASQIASNYAFEKGDWLFPGYRDIPQLIMKGWPIYKAFLWSRGHFEGNEFEDVNGWFPQIIIGAQYVEAAGAALGLKKRNKPNVAYAYTGDGGTSQGDFYEGMNFAGAYHAPAVFFAQNNGYAISTPRSVQTKAPHLAAKGWAAGLPSFVVDGMDPIAMYLAAKEARKWAVDGNGPVFIETITNRLGPHSMSGDDPLRYRTQEDIDNWTKREPLIRFRKYLTDCDLWSEDIENDWADIVNSQIDDAVKQADGIAKQKISDFIEQTLEVPGQAAQDQINKFRGEGK
ncbi:thiamine pyrophosphate-dependent dehydrogenase E1 component subunit alpha [Pediococcus acidilactici]|uniref:thiamine pyrophosphate-dependent dehydrogenase E1 component subunit alpha n=1 Tax=Pediococcus acidilactici TaxID=1254 RepID=UPI0019131EBB|nr:thiamine pyrophosphate-dependent dehydrogenase E1 component subunit alpha [Pediococcus acidilactici]QQP83291.1 thiamine pyrophosphate-dependent dehydrogenase E1 component subunit alpha [Pediococcus acidilactici]